MTGLVAVTGATGFIGRSLIDHLARGGFRLRALARRPQSVPQRPGLSVLHGSLEDSASLGRLISEADAVVHCAGAVKARSTADFHVVNAGGTARVAKAVAAAGHRPRAEGPAGSAPGAGAVRLGVCRSWASPGSPHCPTSEEDRR